MSRNCHFCADHKLSTRIDGHDDVVFSLLLYLEFLAQKDQLSVHLPLKVVDQEQFADLEQRLCRKPFLEKDDHTRSSSIVMYIKSALATKLFEELPFGLL